MEENVYTVKEVSDFLKVSVKTVRNYIAAGTLKAFKVGDKWRITETELQKFIQPNNQQKGDS